MEQAQPRTGNISRKTAETDISLRLVLDGNGTGNSDTGIAFFDHMLTLLARHSRCDLDLTARGDLEVDGHHTVEDVGICLGQALAAALGDYGGIARYGSATIPMDEARCTVAIDLSRRPFLVYRVPVKVERIGSFETELVEEFFRAFSVHGGLTLHIDVAYGSNQHHLFEAVFKAVAHALRRAWAVERELHGEPLSSKGVL
jgi:imidazoleglycerol-phosphate dehydratase